MILSASQHRTIASILREKAQKAPDPIVAARLLRLADQHDGMALYLNRNPHRGPVPAVASPSISRR